MFQFQHRQLEQRKYKDQLKKHRILIDYIKGSFEVANSCKEDIIYFRYINFTWEIIAGCYRPYHFFGDRKNLDLFIKMFSEFYSKREHSEKRIMTKENFEKLKKFNYLEFLKNK